MAQTRFYYKVNWTETEPDRFEIPSKNFQEYWNSTIIKTCISNPLDKSVSYLVIDKKAPAKFVGSGKYLEVVTKSIYTTKTVPFITEHRKFDIKRED